MARKKIRRTVIGSDQAARERLSKEAHRMFSADIFGRILPTLRQMDADQIMICIDVAPAGVKGRTLQMQLTFRVMPAAESASIPTTGVGMIAAREGDRCYATFGTPWGLLEYSQVDGGPISVVSTMGMGEGDLRSAMIDAASRRPAAEA